MWILIKSESVHASRKIYAQSAACTAHYFVRARTCCVREVDIETAVWNDEKFEHARGKRRTAHKRKQELKNATNFTETYSKG
eukprot:6184460-Pleurochrysis_carterae.AAC.3